MIFCTPRFGIREALNRTLDPATFFRRAAAGLKISVFAGLVTGAYVFAHFSLLSPGYAETLISELRNLPSVATLPESEWIVVEGLLRSAYSPEGLAVATPLVYTIIGGTGSLIGSAVLRRRASTANF